MAGGALQQSLQMGPEGLQNVTMSLSLVNSILHIFESILSQEELPDFYEEKLPQIAEVCLFVLDTDFAQITQAADYEKLFKARAKVVRMAQLYQFKFSEYF